MAVEKQWGGKRERAGRPKIETKRKLRSLKFNDDEWTEIQNKAINKGLSIREYLSSLVKIDN
jgi:hypothetical protein